jgi:phage-related protein
VIRPAIFDARARQKIQSFPKAVRLALGKAIFDLQRGSQPGMPLSRSMPTVAPGVHELRIKDEDGIYRVFYIFKSVRGVFILHAFAKKTQKTPLREIELARKRLREFVERGLFP